MVKNRMKLRPMNKMIILIRERIVDTNSIFILCKVLCIVEAGQELLMLRVAWHPHDRSLRAQNTAPGWFQHVGVFAQQFGPYSVFPQLGHQNKAAKTAICKGRSPSSTWSDCPLSASVCRPTPPWPSSRRHLRIQQTDKNASAQIYYLWLRNVRQGKHNLLLEDAPGDRRSPSHQIKSVASLVTK